MNQQLEGYFEQLDRNSKIPLYRQLYYILKDLIDHDILRHGDKFFSESELSEIFDVSRITIRSALRQLEEEEYIKKSQGNVSVVLGAPKFLWDFHDLTDDLVKHGKDLKTFVISAEEIAASDNVREKLDLRASEQTVYKIERLRIVGKRKMAYSISYLIPSLQLDIDQIRETENLKIRDLLRAHGEDPYIAAETIEAVNANEITSELLDLPSNFAVFCRKRITYDRDKKPLEYVISYFNSRYTKYVNRDVRIKRTI